MCSSDTRGPLLALIADADGGLLQRHFGQAHGHRRRVGFGRVGARRDHDAFEQAGPLQALLVVEQQHFGGRRARLEVGQVARAGVFLPCEAFDDQGAGAEQRPRLGRDVHPHAGVVGIDLGPGRAPGGAGVAVGAQLGQRGVLGLAPRAVGERAARRQAPRLVPGSERVARPGVAGRGRVGQRAVQRDVGLCDAGLSAGRDADVHPRHLAGRAGFALHAHLGLHVALRGQQRARLCGRGGLEPAQFGLGQCFTRRQDGQARQVEVILEQPSLRLGRIDRQHDLRRHCGRYRVGCRPERRAAGKPAGQRDAERARPRHAPDAAQVDAAPVAARCGPGPTETRRAHLLSSRIAPSRPDSVSGNMRWFIS